MTLTSTTTVVSYAGNGSTSSFAIPFRFFENSHIKATLTDSGGDDTVWVLGTEYTLSGAGDAAGGTLTVATTPTDYRPASGETLTIERVTPLTQETSLPLGGPLPSDSIEQMVDQTVMNAQENAQNLSRSVRFPTTDSVTLSAELPGASSRASKYLAFDAAGEPIASTGPTGASEIPVSSYIETLLDDSDAATARTTLGAEKLSITTRGDIIRGSSAGVAERLALGSDGEVLGSDGTDLVNLPHPGIASVQVFTSSDTWTRPAGVRLVHIVAIGGGGGGGGADSNGSTATTGGGGGGGGTAEKLLDVTGIASSTITVGAAGAGGTAAGGIGGTGGDSSWADGTNTVTGNGGVGGTGSGSAPGSSGTFEGGSGGVGSGGDFNIRGNGGGTGGGAGLPGRTTGGAGGGSTRGGGGFGGAISGASAASGQTGGQYGGGGGGAANSSTAAGAAGGAGAAGVVIVWEYQ